MRVRRWLPIVLSVWLGLTGAGLTIASPPALAGGQPAQVLTGAARDLNDASAVLAGTVNPAGVPVTGCTFEYGASEAYGSSVACSSLPGGGTAPVEVEAPITGLLPGKLYHFRLRIESTSGNAEGEDATFASPPAVIGSVLVSNVTSFAATLTSAIQPGTELYTPDYYFAYGPSSAYGLRAPTPAGIGAADHQGTVTQTLTGLQPATTYHVQLVTTNAGGGLTKGPDATFTTRPLVPPGVVTGTALALTEIGATLSGIINAEGLPTSYLFEYGLTTSYGSSWPTVQVFAGSGGEGKGIAVEVPGLAPASVYHYRLVATNEDGTTYGADRTLATPAYPVTAIQETPLEETPLGIDPEIKSSSIGRKSSGKARSKTKKRAKTRKRKVRRKG